MPVDVPDKPDAVSRVETMMGEVAKDRDRLREAITAFLDGRMAEFTDSRMVDDDLVTLAAALCESESGQPLRDYQKQALLAFRYSSGPRKVSAMPQWPYGGGRRMGKTAEADGRLRSAFDVCGPQPTKDEPRIPLDAPPTARREGKTRLQARWPLEECPPCSHCAEPAGAPCTAAEHGYPERCLRQPEYTRACPADACLHTVECNDAQRCVFAGKPVKPRVDTRSHSPIDDIGRFFRRLTLRGYEDV